ncbi:hypothetical protein [Telmatospirillum sp.]|uniref:hypothetical protein n=1 Tax=Telmatospirillum sp. TaxID=2079197 RepID=UPI00285147C6|nr:hypothetical protein [Telmatospirillum sp.]MDR3436265.1 hypothetical protein [Telmatospirillum sp.]
MVMKIGLAIGLVMLTSACSGLNDIGYFAPQVVEGDDSYVVIYDSNGIMPSSAIAAANKYCSKYAKTAEMQSRGGSSHECVSKQLNYCATYSCK